MALNDATLKKYLRDDASMERPPSRAFLANVINSVFPEYLPSIIRSQTIARHGKEASERKGDDIKVMPQFMQALSNTAFSDS